MSQEEKISSARIQNFSLHKISEYEMNAFVLCHVRVGNVSTIRNCVMSDTHGSQEQES